MKLAVGDKLCDALVHEYPDGWDYYIDPNNITDWGNVIDNSRTIEQQIQDAIDCENYELAEKLKQKLESSK